VYTPYGIGRVAAREKRAVLGAEREIVVLELADGLTVTLPMERAREHLRPAASEAYLRGDIHANLVASLSRPPVAALYIVANLVLAPHIFHGTWSLFQSLGINHPRFNQWRRYLAWAVAIVLTAGNLSFPVAIWAGWLKPL